MCIFERYTSTVLDRHVHLTLHHAVVEIVLLVANQLHFVWKETMSCRQRQLIYGLSGVRQLGVNSYQIRALHIDQYVLQIFIGKVVRIIYENLKVKRSKLLLMLESRSFEVNDS